MTKRLTPTQLAENARAARARADADPTPHNRSTATRLERLAAAATATQPATPAPPPNSLDSRAESILAGVLAGTLDPRPEIKQIHNDCKPQTPPLYIEAKLRAAYSFWCISEEAKSDPTEELIKRSLELTEEPRATARAVLSDIAQHTHTNEELSRLSRLIAALHDITRTALPYTLTLLEEEHPLSLAKVEAYFNKALNISRLAQPTHEQIDAIKEACYAIRQHYDAMSMRFVRQLLGDPKAMRAAIFKQGKK